MTGSVLTAVSGAISHNLLFTLDKMPDSVTETWCILLTTFVHKSCGQNEWLCGVYASWRPFLAEVPAVALKRLCTVMHDDVIKWKHFPRYRSFVRGIHRSPVNSRHKGQWRRALMFSFICAWINIWVNNREAGDLRHHRAHYDVIVMVDSLCRNSTHRSRCNWNMSRYNWNSSRYNSDQ